MYPVFNWVFLNWSCLQDCAFCGIHWETFGSGGGIGDKTLLSRKNVFPALSYSVAYRFESRILLQPAVVAQECIAGVWYWRLLSTYEKKLFVKIHIYRLFHPDLLIHWSASVNTEKYFWSFPHRSVVPVLAHWHTTLRGKVQNIPSPVYRSAGYKKCQQGSEPADSCHGKHGTGYYGDSFSF